jgi:periplasmic divalent cation tolerance protein
VANPCILYVTASSGDEAERISRALLEERLVACVNILENITSHYWWKGEIQTGNEVLLIAKTMDTLVARAVEKVKSIHSYECPCIVSLPISGGNPAFIKWLEEETGFGGG